MFAPAELSATPKLLEGLVTQPCTSPVTSSITYWPATDAVKLAFVDPSVGSVAAVTEYSSQAELTSDRFTRPCAFTRLINRVSVACEIWLAVSPAGRLPTSNCNSAVFPPPTYRFEILPKFVEVRVAFTYVSPTRRTSEACATEPQAAAARHKANGRTRFKQYSCSRHMRARLRMLQERPLRPGGKHHFCLRQQTKFMGATLPDKTSHAGCPRGVILSQNNHE